MLANESLGNSTDETNCRRPPGRAVCYASSRRAKKKRFITQGSRRFLSVSKRVKARELTSCTTTLQRKPRNQCAHDCALSLSPSFASGLGFPGAQVIMKISKGKFPTMRSAGSIQTLEALWFDNAVLNSGLQQLRYGLRKQ